MDKEEATESRDTYMQDFAIKYYQNEQQIIVPEAHV